MMRPDLGMGEFKMVEKTPAANSRNMHAIILGVIGILLLIVGLAIITIRGAPLRGSGFGTIATVLGFLLLVIAALRFFYKRP
jgi:hypothetical protein